MVMAPEKGPNTGQNSSGERYIQDRERLFRPKSV